MLNGRGVGLKTGCDGGNGRACDAEPAANASLACAITAVRGVGSNVGAEPGTGLARPDCWNAEARTVVLAAGAGRVFSLLSAGLATAVDDWMSLGASPGLQSVYDRLTNDALFLSGMAAADEPAPASPRSA